MNDMGGSWGIYKDVAGLYRENEELLERISRVVAASESEDLAGLADALRDLLARMESRFEREERLMREPRNETAAAHRLAHRQLLNEIRNQLDDLAGGKPTLAYIGRFMRNWMLQHLVDQDTEFANALVPQGDDAPFPEFEERDEREERRLEILEPIRWAAELEIGDAQIDAEHRAIITLLNAIIDANEDDDRRRLAELLEQLGDQTATHFQNEERWMANISHKLLDEHRAEHQRLLDEYANQVEEFRNGSISAEFLCRFIYRWFVHHIEGLDASLKAA
ncbi:MAG: hemerythrin family protein [Propionivibrio sp.]